MGVVLIEEDLLIQHKIIDRDLPAGQKIHAFLEARARALAGKYIDFDKTPVTFLLSTREDPNAFFAPISEFQNRPRLSRSREERQESIIYTPNPYDTPVICVTKGLIDMVESVDELDYILGHELTHLILNGFGITDSNKGEEEVSDLHSIDLVYDAGGDPKQALIIADKIRAYHEALGDQDQYGRNAKEEGIDWSEVFSKYMTSMNRRSALEASLTRISHLIDDRAPSEFDKSVFETEYSDPIDAYLEEHNYSEKEPLEKLKLLIDLIDDFSVDAAPEQLVREQMSALSWDASTGYVPQEEQKLIIFRERQGEGHKGYFSGKVMEAKYKQKIAQLSEEVFDDYYAAELERVKEELGDEFDEGRHYGNELKDLDTIPLSIYLQDRAYEHIKKHGYPQVRDVNYHDSSALLFSYFYSFLTYKTSYESRIAYEENAEKRLPQISSDIMVTKKRIREAKTADDFKRHCAKLAYLGETLVDIRSLSYGYYSRESKLNNLSLFDPHQSFSDDTHNRDTVYGSEDKQAGQEAPWNNLIAIAQADYSATELVIATLKASGIHDYRITHNLPFIKMGDRTCYKIDEQGVIALESIPEYELHFALNRSDVLATYDYVKTYFAQEDDYFKAICERTVAASLDESEERDDKTKTFNRRSRHLDWANELIDAFNSLPSDDDLRDYENNRVLYAIPHSYEHQNQMPGTHENGRFALSEKLFQYDNPIFQHYFGADFQEQVQVRKRALQQQLFEASFQVIQNSSKNWLATCKKLTELKATLSQNQNMGDDETKELRDNIEFYEGRKRNLDAVVTTYAESIFNDQRHSNKIARFTDGQKRTIAKYIVEDRENIFVHLLSDNRYETFCDYLDILKDQTEQSVSRSHALTPAMQVVADNLGYKTASTRDELEQFSDNINKKGRYARALHACDLSVYLSHSSSYDIPKLVRSFSAIKQDQPSDYGQRGFKAKTLYNSYRKFMSSSSLLALITNAINLKDNYKGFDFSQNISVIDDLVAFRKQMSALLHMEDRPDWRRELRYDYSSSRAKKFIIRAKNTVAEYFNATVTHLNITSLIPTDDKMRTRNQEFLEMLDHNIKSLIRTAQQQVLDMTCPLAKMEKLHWLYKSETVYFSDSDKRTYFLNEVVNEDNSLDSIAALSKSDSFWPDDTLDHIKAFIFAKQTFIDDVVLEDALLNKIYDKVASLPAGKHKNECLYTLLDCEIRAPYPETRQRLFNIYINDVFNKLGKDNSSEKYQRRLAVYIKALEGGHFEREYSRDRDRDHHDFIAHRMSSADKYILLRQLSDQIVSQEQTSEMFKKSCQINLTAEDLKYSYLYGIGIDALTSDMDSNPKTANKVIQFLNSNGNNSQCENLSEHMKFNIRTRERLRDTSPERIQELTKRITPERCKALYDNFWAAPLEARAVVIARLLKSAVSEQEKVAGQEPWETVFDLVMANVIRPEDTSVEALYARDIMHSYIKSRSDYERELILSAMMVANRNIGKDAGNVGKALKLFLENMGPAEIKLGQAIASHPKTPESIKRELQDLKSAADLQARWTIYDWIRDENIPEEFWKGKYLGDILGSASYYTTIELGDDEVLRILRPEAREKAKKGFRVLSSTITDLEEKDQVSNLDYRELTSSVQEMVKQAARMSDIETDHNLGEQQCEYAKDIYNGVTIQSGSETFTLKVMDWRARGKNWIILKKADGYLFNDLPENTPQELAYKKQFAKGYITFELMNILSGKKFDHDKHGAQLCINPETNEVGIFDTGAMALNDPTEEEQRVLGHVLYDAIKASILGKKSFTIFSDAITRQIESLHEQGLDTQYLVEVKKGLLALGDFFSVLDEKDTQDIMPGLDMLDRLSPEIQQGIYEQMSKIEKMQFTAFSKSRAFNQNRAITIHKSDTPTSANGEVTNVTTLPTSKDKSAWLTHSLSKPDQDLDINKPGDTQEYNQRKLVIAG